MIWFEEAKEEDKPPPFEFCTNTINISRAQTIKIKIERLPVLLQLKLCIIGTAMLHSGMIVEVFTIQEESRAHMALKANPREGSF